MDAAGGNAGGSMIMHYPAAADMLELAVPGPGDAGAVLLRPRLLHSRLEGAQSPHCQHGHADRAWLVGGVLLQHRSIDLRLGRPCVLSKRRR